MLNAISPWIFLLQFSLVSSEVGQVKRHVFPPILHRMICLIIGNLHVSNCKEMCTYPPVSHGPKI